MAYATAPAAAQPPIASSATSSQPQLAPRTRVAQDILGDQPPGAAIPGTSEPPATAAVAAAVVAVPAPTEQDELCELAAAGIIVACQMDGDGVCDVSMRGITRLPPALTKYFRAEGALVRELQLQGNRLTAACLPPLHLLPALTALDLSSNLLEQVPADVGCLGRLRDLDLSRNEELRELPQQLCDLTALTRLDLSHCGLECLPLRMERLGRLVEMRLDGNSLSYLPPAAGALPSLTALHASHNRLTALPAELCGASSLTGIFVAHNQLTALPASLGQLRQRLSELQLHSNCLSVLPRELGLLLSLTRLTSAGNPLVHPPLDVARQGVAAVREYLLRHGAARAGGSADGGGGEGGEEDEGGGSGKEGDSSEREVGSQDKGGSSGAEEEGDAGEQRPRPRHDRGATAAPRAFGGSCVACADKADRIEDLNQLLRDARERQERSERQLDQAREQMSRQSRDLAAQAVQLVELQGEATRLTRQLQAAALQPGYRAGSTHGSGGGASASRQGEVEAALRGEAADLRKQLEAAQVAVEAAERELRQQRHRTQEAEAQAALARERSQEVDGALQRERQRCDAATAAATAAEGEVARLGGVQAERDSLRTELRATKASQEEAWAAAASARDGQLAAEGRADMTAGRLAAAMSKCRALDQQLQGQQEQAARDAAEAASRERALRNELARLQADNAALTAERELLAPPARPKAAQQHPGGWLKLNGQHDTESDGVCNGSCGPLTSGTVSKLSADLCCSGDAADSLQRRAGPAPEQEPALASASAASALSNGSTPAAAAAATALCSAPAAAAEQRPSPVWSDLLGARLHNYVSELREKAAARDSDGTEFTTAILQHQLLRLQRRSPHGSVSAREMDSLNRRLRIHGAAAAAAAAAAVSRAARSGGAAAGGSGPGAGMGLIKAAPRGGLPPGYRLVRDALLEAARGELLEGLKRVSAAHIAEGLMATAPPPPTSLVAGGGGLGLGGGGGGSGAGLALNTIYTGTMDVQGSARACLPGRAAVMVGVLGLLALEPAWVLPALPPPKLPAWRSAAPAASSASASASAGPLGALRPGSNIGGSSSGSSSTSTTSIALLGGGGRGQHLSAAVALADALLRHRGLPPLPYHELRMLVVVVALLQEHPDLVDPVSGAPGCPAWGLASALELLVPLAGVLATSPVCGMAGSGDAVAHARTAGPVVRMHLAAAQAALAAATLTQSMASKQGKGASVAASQGSGGGVTARGGSSRSSTSNSSSAAATTTVTSTATGSSTSSSSSNGTSCGEDGSEAGDAAAASPSSSAGVDPRLFVREYVRCMKRQAERAAQDGLEEAPLCLWVAGRLPQALAPFLELGGAGTAAGGGPGAPLPLGARSGAGGGGGGTLRLTGGLRRDRMLRYELLRTVLATGLDGAPRSVQAVGGDAMKALLMSAAVVGYLRGASAWEAEQILANHHNAATTSSNGGGGSSSSNGSSASSIFSPGGKGADAGVVRGVDEGPVGLRLSSSVALLAEHSAAVRADTPPTSTRQRQEQLLLSARAADPSAPGLVAASLVPCGSAHLLHCRALREGPPTIEVMATSGVVEAPRDPHAQRRLRERVLEALRERRAVRLQCLSGPTVELAMLVLAQVCSDMRLDGLDVVVVPELDPPDDQLPAAVAELLGGLVEPLGGAGGSSSSGSGPLGTSWRQQALAAGAVSAEAGADAEPDAWSQPLGGAALPAPASDAADAAAAARAGSARSGGGGGGLRDGWRVLRRAGINRAACALLGVAGVGGSNEAEEAEALDGRLLLDFYPGLLAAMRKAAGAGGAGGFGGGLGLGLGTDLEAGMGSGLDSGDGLEEELLNAAGREYERTTARPRLCDVPERVWVTLCVMICAPGRLGAPGRPLPLQELPPLGSPAATGKRQQAPAGASASAAAAAPAAAGAVAAGGAEAGVQAGGAAVTSTAAARSTGRRGGAAAPGVGAGAAAVAAVSGAIARRTVAL
ncbi:hypothetical protein HXX76_015338 [Chlamydomonas incerta]|uniref:Uncharacterized protein n=1 Tax=Chlamydomonas incerta TaxID=51695 RepID=A0A835SHE3_CHLIN|nr:hypothetical protein HXX76_015338 [Chlamydomonas incerta]|eukprot:KAG2423468.1 hypothetical protein HXX76_015338 [Chlamydomonas incerta]